MADWMERRLLDLLSSIYIYNEHRAWTPYESWLAKHHAKVSSWRERMMDRFIHAELIVLKLPILFLSPRLPRQTMWPDADEAVSAAQ